MTWIDALILLFIVLTSVAAAYRGVIGELFDLLILTVGVTFSFWTFAIPGGILESTHIMPEYQGYLISFIVILTMTAVGLFMMGRHYEGKYEDDYGPGNKKPLAVFIGFLKGFVIVFFILTFAGNIIKSESFVKTARSSFTVRMIQSTEPIFEDTALALTPENARKPIRKYLWNSLFLEKKL